MLDIIIVNWNAGPQLRECLESIAATTREGFQLGRVVIVDNASSDGSTDHLDDIKLPLVLILNKKNLGFAAACNQGAKRCKADYLLFLNPDTRLFSNSLSRPIRFMEQPKNAKVGICGIRLVDKDGKMTTSAARFPRLRILVGKNTRLSKLFPKIFPTHLMSSYELVHSRMVEQVIGAFFLVRRDVFISLDGLDEKFFMYFEEVDFSLRAQMKGYTSYYLAEASAYHEGGGCSGSIKADRLFYSLRSRIYYSLKHYSHIDSILLIFFTFFIEFFARIFFVRRKPLFPYVRDTIISYKKLLTHYIKKW